MIGLAIAWRAAQRGIRIAVFERGEFGAGSSRIAAGMIAPISEARATEQPLLQLNLRSSHAYPEFVAELAERSRRWIPATSAAARLLPPAMPTTPRRCSAS